MPLKYEPGDPAVLYRGTRTSTSEKRAWKPGRLNQIYEMKRLQTTRLKWQHFETLTDQWLNLPADRVVCGHPSGHGYENGGLLIPTRSGHCTHTHTHTGGATALNQSAAGSSVPKTEMVPLRNPTHPQMPTPGGMIACSKGKFPFRLGRHLDTKQEGKFKCQDRMRPP
jgi:hypothetical protein